MSVDIKARPAVDEKNKDATSGGFVVLKDGKSGLRFGPVVTGQVALGKDGCGY